MYDVGLNSISNHQKLKVENMVHVAPPGGWTHDPIHPDRWADQMLKAWKVRITQFFFKISTINF